MRRALFFLLTATTIFAAEDAWTKVSKLKSGAEVRIFKRATSQPMLGKLDEVTDDNVDQGPLRLALTGMDHGPELVRAIPLLERASECDARVLSPLARVERCIG